MELPLSGTLVLTSPLEMALAQYTLRVPLTQLAIEAAPIGVPLLRVHPRDARTAHETAS